MKLNHTDGERVEKLRVRKIKCEIYEEMRALQFIGEIKTVDKIYEVLEKAIQPTRLETVREVRGELLEEVEFYCGKEDKDGWAQIDLASLRERLKSLKEK